MAVGRPTAKQLQFFDVLVSAQSNEETAPVRHTCDIRAQVFEVIFLYNKGLSIGHNKCILCKYEKNIPDYNDFYAAMAYWLEGR